MKALTLTEPWATLVALGKKSIETRDWSTRYRGPIAIHAAKKFPSDARALVPIEPFASALGMETLRPGQLLAVVDLTQCFRFDHNTAMQIEGRALTNRLPDHELAFGDYTPGRYGFVLRSVRRLADPIPARGMLGLWEIPANIAAAIDAQLATGVPS